MKKVDILYDNLKSLSLVYSCHYHSAFANFKNIVHAIELNFFFIMKLDFMEKNIYVCTSMYIMYIYMFYLNIKYATII